MKKILLIYPLSSAGEQTVYPVGLAYILSYLREKKLPAFIFDRNAAIHKKKESREQTDKMMMRQLEKLRPDYVGFSMMSTNFSDVNYCAKQIKAVFPEIEIIAGGIHPTYEIERTMIQIPEVDFIVQGPGEYALESVLQYKKWERIPNVVYRNGNEIVQTHKQKIKRSLEIQIDFSSFGFDIYWQGDSELINVLDVFNRPAVLITQQGCPGSCTFCVDDRYKGYGFYHSTDFVLDDMARLKNEYGRQSFLFYDRVFRGSKKKAIEFCKQKIERGMAHIPWGASFRTDFITEEVCWYAKESGCIFIAAGLEAASQGMLDFLRKGTTVEQNYKAFKLLTDNQIMFLGSFIYGLPGQTESDLKENIRFFDQFQFADSGISQIAPFPGSKLYADLIKQKKINPDNPQYWELVNSFEQPVPELNFSEIPDERYIELFHEHANYIFNTCRENRVNQIDRILSRMQDKYLMNHNKKYS